VAAKQDSLITGPYNTYNISPEQNTANPETNGNLDNLSP
jgi:hypothetical protein